jgi:hypothetical protein
VWEQQHDQASDRFEALEAFAAAQLVAAAGGQQPPLPCVQDHRSGPRGSVADAGYELSTAHQHRGKSLDPVVGDVAAGVGRQLDLLELDTHDPPFAGVLGHLGDVEQGGGGE